jgi:hypothetical protein
MGENYVVKKGYYSYSPENEPFIDSVPIWIIPLWLFMIQFTALCGHAIGLGYVDIIVTTGIRFGGVAVCIFSGLVCFLIDFLLIEPYFSRKSGLWIWTSVENGYFGFVPREFNKFTAPLGNYLVWFGFPITANYIVVVLFALTN